MTADDIYWPYVAFATGAGAIIPFVCFALARRWTWIALIVGVACLVVVVVNGAAPIRGALDPNYIGYSYGFLRADKGIAVTLIAGSVVSFSALSSWIAIAIARARRCSLSRQPLPSISSMPVFRSSTDCSPIRKPWRSNSAST